nr:hypothetical protein OH820_24380 [Streptomyces sp. NBC_00857]
MGTAQADSATSTSASAVCETGWGSAEKLVRPSENYKPPLPGVDITGYDAFKDTRYIDALEDDVLVGVGVRARLPFRVTQSGGQLIVDVAHSWNATF